MVGQDAGFVMLFVSEGVRLAKDFVVIVVIDDAVVAIVLLLIFPRAEKLGAILITKETIEGAVALTFSGGIGEEGEELGILIFSTVEADEWSHELVIGLAFLVAICGRSEWEEIIFVIEVLGSGDEERAAGFGLSAEGSLASAISHFKAKASEDSDDGDHHEEFDEGEALAVFGKRGSVFHKGRFYLKETSLDGKEKSQVLGKSVRRPYIVPTIYGK